MLYSIVFYHPLNQLKNDFLIEIYFIVSLDIYLISNNQKNKIISSKWININIRTSSNDVNFQIDTFLEDQKRDEDDFLGHFDPSDNQAVCQAIQLQVC